jgi:hypothetical protein
VHHSDRGSPYASAEYRAALATSGLVASMSRKGDCWDNAVAESFFGTLRAELIDLAPCGERLVGTEQGRTAGCRSGGWGPCIWNPVPNCRSTSDDRGVCITPSWVVNVPAEFNAPPRDLNWRPLSAVPALSHDSGTPLHPHAPFRSCCSSRARRAHRGKRRPLLPRGSWRGLGNTRARRRVSCRRTPAVEDAARHPGCRHFVGVFLLSTVIMVREFTEVRARWSAGVLTSITPWRRERSIRWDRVASVKFSRAASWFVVRGADGTVIRLPTLLGGLRCLVEEMRWRCPPPVQGRIEDEIRRWERAGTRFIPENCSREPQGVRGLRVNGSGELRSIKRMLFEGSRELRAIIRMRSGSSEELRATIRFSSRGSPQLSDHSAHPAFKG